MRSVRSLRRLNLECLEDRLVPSGPGTWSAFNPGTGPDRWGAPLVALGPLAQGDTFKTVGTNYFFGGTDGTNTFDDTWGIAQTAVLPVPLNPPTSPLARHDHAAVAFNNQMYIFGGEDANGNSLNDVWAFDPLSDTWTQQPSQQSSQTWPGAFDAVAVTIGQQIILYGGSVAVNGTAHAADAFAYGYNPGDGSWSKLAADPLGADTGATAAPFGGKMYVFSSTSSTIEALDPVQNSWSQLNVQGTTPPPRAHAGGASIQNFFMLVGGAGTQGDNWIFNFTTNTWQQKANEADSGVQFQGATGFIFQFGIGEPTFMTYGGAVIDQTTSQLTPVTDNPVERFSGLGAIFTNDGRIGPGLPGLVVPRLIVPEPSGQATFTVSTGSGSGSVTMPVSSTNPADGTVSPSQLFAAANANGSGTITVTGGSAPPLGGRQLYQVQLGPLVSSDADFNGLTVFVPIIAVPQPVFTPGVAGTYTVADHLKDVQFFGPELKLIKGTLPKGLKFLSDSATVSYIITGTPAAGTQGAYPLTFQRTGGETTTLSFTLLVGNSTITITQKPPASVSVAAGARVTLTAKATGLPTPSIQWQVSTDGGATFANIEGATSTTLSFPATIERNGEQFQAVFTNVIGQATTNPPTILTVTSPPVVTAQPANQTVALGGTAMFSAAADGNPPITGVQWQVKAPGGRFTNLGDGNGVSGATTDTLTLTNVSAGMNGNEYRVVFSNAQSATATSKPASVTLGTLPQISPQPTDQKVNAGQRVTFKAGATGSPMPTVQWQVSVNSGPFADIPGATSPTLSFIVHPGENGDLYQAIFTNAVGSTPSNIVKLTVDFPLRITTQPVSQTAAVNGNATFSAAASGNPPFDKVQWEVKSKGGSFTVLSNGNGVSGADTETLTLTGVTSAMSGDEYVAVFSAGQATATTAPAILTVTNLPVVSAQPTTQTEEVNGTATFTVAATGNPAISKVQWQVKVPGGKFTNLSNGNNVAGADTDTLMLTGLTATMNGNRYRAILTNSTATTTTQAATLSVQTPPAIARKPTNQAVMVGQVVKFTAAASGTSPTVQWYVSSDGGKTFQLLAGATSATLAFKSTASENGFRYHAVFTNAVGQATTEDVGLVIW